MFIILYCIAIFIASAVIYGTIAPSATSDKWHFQDVIMFILWSIFWPLVLVLVIWLLIVEKVKEL